MKINITRFCILLTVVWGVAIAIIVIPDVYSQYNSVLQSRELLWWRVQKKEIKERQKSLEVAAERELDKLPRYKLNELCGVLFQKQANQPTSGFSLPDGLSCGQLAVHYKAVPLPTLPPRARLEPEMKPGQIMKRDILASTLKNKLSEHWMLLSLLLIIWLIPPALRFVTTGDGIKKSDKS